MVIECAPLRVIGCAPLRLLPSSDRGGDAWFGLLRLCGTALRAPSPPTARVAAPSPAPAAARVAVRRGDGERAEQGEDGGGGQDGPRGALGVRLVLGEQQAPLGGRRLGAETEEGEGGEGEGDAGEPQQGVPDDGRQHGGQQFVAQQIPAAGAQGAGGGDVRGGAFLEQQGGGVRGERCPGDGAHGERGGGRSAAGDGGDEERGEDGRYSVDGVDERSGQAGHQPEQHSGEQGGGAEAEGEQQGVEGAVGDPGEQVTAEGVGAEGMAPRGGSEAGGGVEGEGVTRQSEHDDDEQSAVHEWKDPADGRAWAGRRRAVKCRQRAVARRRARHQPGGDIRQSGRGGGQEQQGERARLEDGQVLGECGLEGRTAEAGNVEDLLDGDGAAGEADDEESGVGQQRGHAPAQGLPDDVAAGHSAGGGGQRPGFGEGAGQQVVEEPSEHGPGGQAEGEGGQDRVLRAVPAERWQPAELHAHDGGEHGRGQELGEGGEHSGAGAARAAPAEPPAAQPQGAGAHQRGGATGDQQGRRRE